MEPRAYWVALSMISFIVLCGGQQIDCQYLFNPAGDTDTTQFLFDLSELRRLSTDYFNGSGASFQYQLNPCGIVDTAPECITSGATLCQSQNGTFVSTVASWTRTPRVTWQLLDSNRPDSGVTQVFANGDSCSGGGARTAVINYHCSTNNLTTFQITESPQCNFVVEFSSTVACPKICDCSDHGLCTFTGECDCEAGYTGTNCLSAAPKDSGLAVGVAVGVVFFILFFGVFIMGRRMARARAKYNAQQAARVDAANTGSAL